MRTLNKYTRFFPHKKPTYKKGSKKKCNKKCSYQIPEIALKQNTIYLKKMVCQVIVQPVLQG